MKRRSLFFAVIVALLVTLTLAVSAENKVTMYARDGRTISIAESAVEAYKAVGWYEGVTVWAADGRSKVVSPFRVDAERAVGWYSNKGEVTVTMYAPDGRTKQVFKKHVDAEKAVGWATEPFVQMWAADGRTKYVVKSQVQANKNVGWFDNKNDVTVTMYAPDGRTKQVFKGKVEAEKAVGWGTEPFVKMYAPDGRTKNVPQSRVAAERAVGWSTEKPKIYPQKVYTTASITLEVGSTHKLAYSFVPENTTETAVTWASGNDSVATVDAYGNVKAVGAGTTKISVMSVNGVYSACNVTVKNKPVTNSRSSIVSYIKTNGEYNGYGSYEMDYLTSNGEYVSMGYDTTLGVLDVSILLNNDTATWMHLELPDGETVYEVTYSFTDSYGYDHMFNGSFNANLDLVNKSNNITISWYTYDDSFIHNSLTYEQKSSVKTLLAYSGRICSTYADVYLLSGTGLSIKSAYGIIG